MSSGIDDKRSDGYEDFRTSFIKSRLTELMTFPGPQAEPRRNLDAPSQIISDNSFNRGSGTTNLKDPNAISACNESTRYSPPEKNRLRQQLERKDELLGVNSLRSGGMKSSTMVIDSVASPKGKSGMERRSSLDLLGETASALELQDRMLKGENSIEDLRDAMQMRIAKAEVDLAMKRNEIECRNSLDLAKRTTEFELAQHQTKLELALQRNEMERRSSIELAQRSTELELEQHQTKLELALQRNTVERRNSLEHAKRAAELELEHYRNNLELTLQRSTMERRNSLEMELALKRIGEERRSSLDLTRRQAELELTLGQERRNSLDLAKRQAELSLQRQDQERRSNLDLSKRQAELDLQALQWQDQERMSSMDFSEREELELSIQRHAQGRRSSMDMATQLALLRCEQERRGSLDLDSKLDSVQRRSSLNGLESAMQRNLIERKSSMDMVQQRNSLDYNLTGNRNTLRSSLSHILAEQFLSDRRLSFYGKSNFLDPIDPRDLDSLFEDNSVSKASSMPSSNSDLMSQVLRRKSLLQSLNFMSNSTSEQLMGASSKTSETTKSSSPMKQTEETDSKQGVEGELSPILNAVASLQQKMAYSQQSQTKIQSWDKRMGLKRSHSSTMTKTHRSRNQLREYFKIHKKLLETQIRLKMRMIEKFSTLVQVFRMISVRVPQMMIQIPLLPSETSRSNFPYFAIINLLISTNI